MEQNRIQPRHSLKEFNRLYREEEALYHELALMADLSDSAFSILYTLCELGDGCLQRDICALSCTSKQTINSSIRKLERDGLIRLESGKRRDMHIFLTEAGREVAAHKILPVIEMENCIFDAMKASEREELLRLMRIYNSLLRDKVKAFKKRE